MPVIPIGPRGVETLRALVMEHTPAVTFLHHALEFVPEPRSKISFQPLDMLGMFSEELKITF